MEPEKTDYAGRLVSPSLRQDDREFDVGLRPKSLDEYIGQVQVKENLRVYMEAAKQRGESLDHVLLFGPPGLGKTTLAHIVANYMGVGIRVTSGPAIERAADLAALLTNLDDGDVLFIDEIHRLSRTVEEILYPAMEDYALDIIIGKGPAARSVRLELPRFTLVGATTRAGLLTSPLRDRFGVLCRLEFYQPEELQVILKRAASILKVELDEEAGVEIARRSRGTPRVANRLLKRVRDFAQVRGDGRITLEAAREGLARMDVDECGLDRTDRRLLWTIAVKFAGGPVGIETLAAAVNEETDTIEDVYEPYLMQLGFLNRTPRGRMITEAACRHLNVPGPGRTKKGRQFDAHPAANSSGSSAQPALFAVGDVAAGDEDA